MIGYFVKNERVRLKLTQEELAEKAKMKATYLSKLERDQLPTPPSEEVLISLAYALQADPHEIIVKAGRVPSDFRDLILEDENVFKYLKRKVAEHNRKEDSNAI
jgi:transcriptional regulator with XRE-family HTH domain